MTMNKKVMVASLFVACLMVASLGAFLPTYSEGGEAVHYKEINTNLDFIDGEEESWTSNVEIINEIAGDTVCSFKSTDTENILTFSKSINLKCTDADVNYVGSITIDETLINIIEESMISPIQTIIDEREKFFEIIQKYISDIYKKQIIN